MHINVKKRDGEVEAYNPENVRKVSVAAGMTEEEAQKLVEEVNKWVKRYEGKTVSSLKIRDIMIKEMPKINKYAADKFIWYENYKKKIS
jgi:hypothetical protein